ETDMWNGSTFLSSFPYGSLLQASNGYLYGMTSGGGYYDVGVVFQYNYSTNTIIDKIDLTGDAGSYPGAEPEFGSLIEVYENTVDIDEIQSTIYCSSSSLSVSYTA